MVCQLLVEVAGTLDASFSMQVRIAPSEHKYKQGLVMAAVVLAVLYILIIFEVNHGFTAPVYTRFSAAV